MHGMFGRGILATEWRSTRSPAYPRSPPRRIATTGASHFQLSTNCRQLKPARFFLSPFHSIPVIARVFTVRQRADDIDDGKKPLLIQPDAANLPCAKNNDFVLRIRLFFLAHSAIFFPQFYRDLTTDIRRRGNCLRHWVANIIMAANMPSPLRRF